ncbi:MAG TPA: preprotein translocase subunit SecG [Patescibacteria group bacterium]|nr:preprotein translocase subunit SecG [Patescibacteria group bacterium]
MMGLFIAVHVLACAILITLILIQRGHGGGLVDAFSSVDSMFGPKTTTFLTRTTTIVATVFFCTCLGLALLSAQRSRSLMRNVPAQPLAATPAHPAAPAQPAAPAAPAAPQQAPAAH